MLMTYSLIFILPPTKKCPSLDNINFIDKNGNEFYLDECTIPNRWLFEDFEEELQKGKAKKQAKLDEEKANIRKMKSLVKSAVKKLSPDELKALKIK